jgi:hypothetical protein
MARYTNLLVLSIDPISHLRQSLADVLQSCGLNLIYEAKDYLVAKEKPGAVSYSKLATVEVLISPPTPQKHSSTINLVVKNEELPLSTNNHCHRVFEQVNSAIATIPT